MKTLTKSTALFFAALLLSLNIFATGFEFDQEDYIEDIPSSIIELVIKVSYENALAVDYSLTEEEYIDDIPVTIENNTSLNVSSERASQDFDFEEEGYIDDIPASIVNHSCYRLYANAK